MNCAKYCKALYQPLTTNYLCSMLSISLKLHDDYQVFLVAGGSSQISSTEVLVEGGHGWSFKEPLPSGRDTLHGISLLDTVILTGKKVLTLTLNITVTTYITHSCRRYLSLHINGG